MDQQRYLLFLLLGVLGVFADERCIDPNPCVVGEFVPGLPNLKGKPQYMDYPYTQDHCDRLYKARGYPCEADICRAVEHERGLPETGAGTCETFMYPDNMETHECICNVDRTYSYGGPMGVWPHLFLRPSE